jgi:AcrR family transcriptional regulator
MSKVQLLGLKAPETGRKAAYFARNRAALILSTQELLGQIGWNATIEEVAAHAEVSISTVYKHFETKDRLFEACVLGAWNDWESWVFERVSSISDPIEALVVPMRLMVRANITHPLFGRILSKNVGPISGMLPSLAKSVSGHLTSLVAEGHIDIDHPQMRVKNMQAILLRLLQEQCQMPDSKASEADLAIELALPILGIPAAKASSIMAIDIRHFNS